MPRTTLNPPMKVNRTLPTTLGYRQAVLAQAPCGKKPASYLVTDKDGNRLFMKELINQGATGKNPKKMAEFQLIIDSLKPVFGIKSVGYTYGNKYLVSSDHNMPTKPYETKEHTTPSGRIYTIVKDGPKTLRDLRFPKNKSTGKPVPSAIIKTDKELDILKVLVFRQFVGASDSVPVNIMVDGEGGILSIDEMAYAGDKMDKKRAEEPDNFIHWLWRKPPSKEMCQQGKEWLKEHSRELMSWANNIDLSKVDIRVNGEVTDVYGTVEAMKRRIDSFIFFLKDSKLNF